MTNEEKNKLSEIYLRGYKEVFRNCPVSRTYHAMMVNDFMHLADQDVPTKPCIPSLEIRRLRAQLILEEALETIHALGFRLDQDDGGLYEYMEPNLVEIVDGCCDLRVVTTGTLSACGVSDALPQFAVDCNNLEKFLPGGYKDQNGKWIKPPNHKKPPLEEILKEQGK